MHIIASSELEGLFREIVTAGWANQSDGNVEAPTGYFAKVTIAAVCRSLNDPQAGGLYGVYANNGRRI